MKWATTKRFDRALTKFCELTPGMEGIMEELTLHEYGDLPLSTKLRILLLSCYSQFDFNFKFKEMVSTPLFPHGCGLDFSYI